MKNRWASMMIYKNLVQLIKEIKRLGIGKFIAKEIVDLAWEEAFDETDETDVPRVP